jgi:hypothetical protein
LPQAWFEPITSAIMPMMTQAMKAPPIKVSTSPPPPETAPVNTAPPVISGTGDEGTALTCAFGTWDANPAPTLAYQWSNGAPIAGATALTYTVTAADAALPITCTETATNNAGTASATSNAIPGIAYVPPPPPPPGRTARSVGAAATPPEDAPPEPPAQAPASQKRRRVE